jgi:hypothetical protein
MICKGIMPFSRDRMREAKPARKTSASKKPAAEPLQPPVAAPPREVAYQCGKRELLIVTLSFYYEDGHNSWRTDEELLQLLAQLGYKLEDVTSFALFAKHFPVDVRAYQKMSYRLTPSCIVRDHPVGDYGMLRKDDVEWRLQAETILCSRKSKPKYRPTMGNK